MRDDQEQRRPAPHRPPRPRNSVARHRHRPGSRRGRKRDPASAGGTTHQARDPVRPANNRATPQRPTPDRLR